MLRPIKSILNYLQLKTNDRQSAKSSSKTVAEMAATTPQGICQNDDSVEDGSDCVVPVPVRKTPHDQNENEVDVQAGQKTSNVSKEQDCSLDDSTKVVDLTSEEICGTAARDNYSESEQLMQPGGSSTAKNDEGSRTKEEVPTADRDVGQAGETSHGQKPWKDDAVVFIDDDDDTETDDVDIYTVSEDAEPLSDEAEIIISDTENVEQEEEEAKSENLDLSLESNEVIILEETDHTDSLTDPLHDPLALDDYNADVSNNMLIPCGSAGHSDTSTESEIIFSVDSGSDVLCEPVAKLKSRQSQRNKRDGFVVEAVSDGARTDEQEVRSDGSDSGLGSEMSTLLSNNSSVVVASTVCKSPSVRSNLKRRSEDSHASAFTKRPKNAINFNGVKVYYFPRVQGFGCVPSQGGCTLGMAAHHVQLRSFSLTEHITEQRRAHKQQMQEINPRNSSSDETDDSEEELSGASGSDLEADANGFLQPVSPRQRRAILKAAGIRKIDASEKDECRAIRSSREFCGCSCRGYCDPDTCSCSQAGIKCQVDRPSFPCGCTRDGCANVVGRVEFNPSRVRTHYIHTIMRLDLENKQKRAMQTEPTSSLSSCTVVASLSSLCNYSNLVNTNHMRQFDAAGSECDIDSHQHNQNSYMSGGSILYPNRALHSTSNVLHVDGSSLLRQRFVDHIGSGAASDEHNIVGGLSIGLQTPTGHNHDMDLHYAFRDDSNSTVDLTTPTGTNSILGIGDYNITDPLYHEVYSGHSFLSQNYSNAPFCQSQPSNYQQSFIDYTPPATSTVELLDIAGESTIELTNAGGPNASNPSYVCLNSPTGNQSRANAINDLLNSSRNVAATSPSQAGSAATSVSYNMPPSAQTSTSITEGTGTTVTAPQMTKPSTSSNAADTKLSAIVDLTDRITPPQNQSEQCKKSRSSDEIVQVVNVSSKEIKIESANDFIVKAEDLDANIFTKLIEQPEAPGSVLDSKSEKAQSTVCPAVVIASAAPNVGENAIVEESKA